MIKKENRPKESMSQVDWLWTNYSDYNVSDTPGSGNSERTILTESAIARMNNMVPDDNFNKLVLETDPDDNTKMRLSAIAKNGTVISVVSIPREEHVSKFERRQITQADIDAGSTLKAGTDALVLETNTGSVYYVSIADLGLHLSGKETDSIFTSVTNGIVSSNIKINDGANKNSVVNINESALGLYADLKIDSTSEIKIEKTKNGIKASIPSGDSGVPIKFDQCTLSQYNAGEKKTNVVYFITDYPYIYLNGVRYGVNILPGDYPIVSITYDKDEMKLYYKKANGDITYVSEFVTASDSQNGFMTSEQVKELKALIKAVGNVTDVQKNIDTAVSLAAYSLEQGTPENGKIPIILKNKLGNVLSTVYIDIENYLSFAVERPATADDVAKAAAKGVTVEEGQPLLILTLNTGDSFYINLTSLTDVYTGLTTNTAKVTVDQYNVSADVIIPEDDKILFKSNDGITSRFSVKKTQKTISFYGKTETDADKLGEFTLSNQLLNCLVINNITQDDTTKYPPAVVNGTPWDEINNPIVYGDSYLLMQTGIKADNGGTDEVYNYYLDVKDISSVPTIEQYNELKSEVDDLKKQIEELKSKIQ